MILMIIFLSITAISIIALIVNAIFFDDEVPYYVFGILCGLFGFVSLCCGIPCICINSEAAIKTKEYKYQEEIKMLQNDKLIIESYKLITSDSNKTAFTSDITFEQISTEEYYRKVSNYNSRVYKFKTDIKHDQYTRKNPWVNWFINEACYSVSDEVLDSLVYTTGR